ncbi:hypothetical protein ACGFY3_21000 [Streptomyces mirabilis]|uniref:hypothetical protein n=1 Tax=Streptomyces mirabilis TaxID=68239 RepID=UPI003721C1F8
MTWGEFVALQVGPCRIGGRYDHGYADSQYEVLAIDRSPREGWPSWQVSVRGRDGEVREHCTGWDPRKDRVIAQPPADVTVVSIGRLHDDEEGREHGVELGEGHLLARLCAAGRLEVHKGGDGVAHRGTDSVRVISHLLAVLAAPDTDSGISRLLQKIELKHTGWVNSCPCVT